MYLCLVIISPICMKFTIDNVNYILLASKSNCIDKCCHCQDAYFIKMKYNEKFEIKIRN
jgi:hypothetical protein